MLRIFIVFTQFFTLVMSALQYGIMIDAGSTGSRIYLYEWEKREQHTHDSNVPIVSQSPFSDPKELDSNKTTPGLSSYADNPAQAGESLSNLTSKIETYLRVKMSVQENTLNKIPIFLQATAGLRILEKSIRLEIMTSVQNFLAKKTPFYFQPSYARIISGEEEGSFGWMTVNYLMTKFLTNTTYGALDMGGASTQITFSSDEIMAGYFPFRVKDNSQPFPLYTHSYLFYGINEISKRLDSLAVSNSHIAPCLPRGYKKNVTVNGTNVEIQGNSDYANCSLIILSFLEKNVPCWGDHCGVSGTYQPSISSDMTFYAFSSYATVANTFNISSKSSIKEMQDASKMVCDMNWEQLKQMFIDKPYLLPYLHMYCFETLYMWRLLTDGFGWDLDSANIVFQDAIDGTDLGWTLGSMLYQSNMRPWEIIIENNEKVYSQKTFQITSGVLGGGMVLLICVIIYLICQKKKAAFIIIYWFLRAKTIDRSR